MEIFSNKQLAYTCNTCSFSLWLDATNQDCIDDTVPADLFRWAQRGQVIFRLRAKQIKALRITAYTGTTDKKLCNTTLVTERIIGMMFQLNTNAWQRTERVYNARLNAAARSGRHKRHNCSQASIIFAEHDCSMQIEKSVRPSC